MKQGMDKNKIIRRIEELRAERKLSRTMLAEKCEIPYPTIRNAFGRDSMPDLYTIERLCKGLDITLADFFTSPAIFESETKDQAELRRCWNIMTEEEKNLTMIFVKGILRDRL